MTDRLTELEWHIVHETDRDIRMRHIREFNHLWEQQHSAIAVQEVALAEKSNRHTGRNSK